MNQHSSLSPDIAEQTFSSNHSDISSTPAGSHLHPSLHPSPHVFAGGQLSTPSSTSSLGLNLLPVGPAPRDDLQQSYGSTQAIHLPLPMDETKVPDIKPSIPSNSGGKGYNGPLKWRHQADWKKHLAQKSSQDLVAGKGDEGKRKKRGKKSKDEGEGEGEAEAEKHGPNQLLLFIEDAAGNPLDPIVLDRYRETLNAAFDKAFKKGLIQDFHVAKTLPDDAKEFLRQEMYPEHPELTLCVAHWKLDWIIKVNLPLWKVKLGKKVQLSEQALKQKRKRRTKGERESISSGPNYWMYSFRLRD